MRTAWLLQGTVTEDIPTSARRSTANEMTGWASQTPAVSSGCHRGSAPPDQRHPHGTDGSDRRGYSRDHSLPLTRQAELRPRPIPGQAHPGVDLLQEEPPPGLRTGSHNGGAWIRTVTARLAAFSRINERPRMMKRLPDDEHAAFEIFSSTAIQKGQSGYTKI